MSNNTTRFVSAAVLALGALASVGCATTQTFKERRADRQLQRKVGRAMLTNADVRRHRVDVDAVDGTVFLRGEVPTEAMKEAATRVALATDGVVEVENQLMGIRKPAVPGIDGEPDTWVTTRIKSQLATNDDTIARNIDVDTVDGVVFLGGVVTDARAKQAAEQIAAGTYRVDRVVNNLVLNSERARLAKVE